MESPHHNHQIRSKWHRPRCFALAWLLVCQFPIPIAHSHEQLAHQDPSGLVAHLKTHHDRTCHLAECDAKCDDDVHWHLVLPWDAAGVSKSEQTPTGFPINAGFPVNAGCVLGLWGGVQLDLAGLPPDCELRSNLNACLCWALIAPNVLVEVLPSAGPQAQLYGGLPHAHAFTQSYMGVSLCELICVCLL